MVKSPTATYQVTMFLAKNKVAIETASKKNKILMNPFLFWLLSDLLERIRAIANPTIPIYPKKKPTSKLLSKKSSA